jgi:hypothetical protein
MHNHLPSQRTGVQSLERLVALQMGTHLRVWQEAQYKIKKKPRGLKPLGFLLRIFSLSISPVPFGTG